jgi:hypothetical protein
MTDKHDNSGLAGCSSLGLAFDRGLSNRLTLIVGPDAYDYGRELDGWLEDLGCESLRIDCPSGDSHGSCRERIIDAFTSAGIIEPIATDIKAEDACHLYLVRLMNGLAALPDDLVVVLHNYHPCDVADRVISFMLEHLPQQIHLYLVSEDVPGLSCIPRLRVRRQFQMIDTAAD